MHPVHLASGFLGVLAAGQLSAADPDRGLVERAAAAVALNADSMPITRLDVRMTVRNVGPPVGVPAEFGFTFKYVVFGDRVRRDSPAENKMPDEFVVQDSEGTFQYLPGSRQGWIRRGPFIEPHPLDLRCVGFANDVRSVARWLKSLRVSDVASREETTSVSGRDAAGTSVSVRLDPGKSYLPTEVTYLRADGTTRVRTEMHYQRHAGGWILSSAVQTAYAEPRGANAGNPKPASTTSWTVTGVAIEDADAAKRTFNPIIPAGASVRFEKDGKNLKLNRGSSVSDLRAVDCEVGEPKPSGQQ